MPTVIVTEFFPYVWIQHFLRALISYQIISVVLKGKDKYNKFVTFISIVGICTLFSGAVIKAIDYESYPMIEALTVVVYYLLQFIICLIVTKDKLIMKITAVFFSLFAYIFSSASTTGIIYLIDKDFFVGFSYEIPLHMFLTECLGTYTMSFIPLIITKLIMSKRNKDITLKNLYFYLFPLTHILTFISQSALIIYSNYNKFEISGLSQLYIVVNTLCFAIDFAILIVIEHMNNVEANNKLLQEQNTLNELEYQKIVIENKENESFRKIRHDYLNLLSTAAGYIEIGKSDKALELINDTKLDVYDPAYIRLCSSDIINAIFSSKIATAKQDDIKINIEIDENANIKIDNYTFCRVLCNLIDNSLNAVKECGAKSFDVSINIDVENVEITTENEFLLKKKAPSKNHGYGTQIIKDILKKQGGNYSQSTNGDIFITKTIIDNK